MSSILKALKKLEEQNRAGREPSSGLPATPSPVRRPAVWRGVGFGVVAGLLAGGLLVWLLLGRSVAPPIAEVIAVPAPDVPAPLATVVAVAKEQPAPPMPTDKDAGEDPPTAPQKSPAEVAPPPSAAPVVKAAPVRPPAVTPAPPAVVTARATLDAADLNAARELPEVRMESFEIPPAGFERAAPRPAGPPPFLVSEIVYEAGSNHNLAVINDLPAMEGTVVDGALLRRILSDRVILVIDGQDIEVPVTPLD